MADHRGHEVMAPHKQAVYLAPWCMGCYELRSEVTPFTLAGLTHPGSVPAYVTREPAADMTVSANWAGEGTMVTLFSFSISTFSRALSPAVLTIAPA